VNQKQQAEIDSLRREYEAFRDESDALRACLENCGLIRQEQFLAQVHRRRFARTLERHPYVSDGGPFEMLQNLELFRTAMRCAGIESARRFAACSRALRWGALVLPPRLYVVGGSDGTAVLSTAEKFDESNNRWETVTPMPTPRSNLVALACDGRLYAIGGTDGVQVSGTVEVLNEDANSWHPLPPMPTARSGMAAATCRGYLYVVGGREGFRSMAVVERFSASANCWEYVPPMRFQRRFLAAAALGGKLYAIGGEDDGFVALRSVECFDDATKSWEDLPSMPTRRRGLAAVAVRGRLYAIGGGHTAMARTSSVLGNSGLITESPRAMALGTVERFDPATKKWETLPPMPTPRMFLQAVVLHGRLYAIGGSDGVQALRTVERFDESTNCWDSLPSMPTRRVFFSVAVLHG